MPEYALSYPEIHLETPGKAIYTIFLDFLPSLGYAIATIILFNFLYFNKISGEPHSCKDVPDRVNQIVAERPFGFKHFTGLCIHFFK